MGKSDSPYTYLGDLFPPLGARSVIHKGRYSYVGKTHAFLMSSLTFVFGGQLMQEHVILSASLLFAKNYFMFREEQDS